MGEINAYNKKAADAFDKAKACFSCRTELILDDAESAICALAPKFNSGEVAVLTSDFGFFSAARGLKDSLFKLGFNAVIFSADDGEINPAAINGFVSSIKKPSFALIIGAEDFYLAAAACLKNAGVLAVYIPTDCEIGRVFREKCRDEFLEPEYLILDEELIARSLNKQKLYSSCCAVEAARLVFFEITAFKRLFCSDGVLSCDGGDLPCERENSDRATNFGLGLEKTRSMLSLSQELLNDYYQNKGLASLLLAGAILELSLRECAVGNAAAAFAMLMRRGDRGALGMRGELELYSAEALFLIYELLLSDGFYDSYSPSFTRADAFFRTERLKNDLSCDYGDISANLPSYIYDSAAVERAVKALAGAEDVKAALGELKSGLTLCRDNLNAVYGGKKRSVREYSLKIRAGALVLSPLCVKGFCVLKLAYAAGMLENVD